MTLRACRSTISKCVRCLSNSKTCLFGTTTSCCPIAHNLLLPLCMVRLNRLSVCRAPRNKSSKRLGSIATTVAFIALSNGVSCKNDGPIMNYTLARNSYASQAATVDATSSVLSTFSSIPSPHGSMHAIRHSSPRFPRFDDMANEMSEMCRSEAHVKTGHKQPGES